MKTIKQHFLFYLLSFFLLGCASLPEPGGANQTLVVGIISNEFVGYGANDGIMAFTPLGTHN